MPAASLPRHLDAASEWDCCTQGPDLINLLILLTENALTHPDLQICMSGNAKSTQIHRIQAHVACARRVQCCRHSKHWHTEMQADTGITDLRMTIAAVHRCISDHGGRQAHSCVVESNSTTREEGTSLQSSEAMGKPMLKQSSTNLREL